MEKPTIWMGLTFIKIFRDIVQDNVKTAIQCLQYAWSVRDSFPNIAVTVGIMMTMSVTMASAERRFFKLKIIKNYLRSTMSQDRLYRQATLSVEKDTANVLDYEDLIHEFAHREQEK